MCGEAAQPCHVPPNTGNRRHYVMILTHSTLQSILQISANGGVSRFIPNHRRIASYSTKQMADSGGPGGSFLFVHYDAAAGARKTIDSRTINSHAQRTAERLRRKASLQKLNSSRIKGFTVRHLNDDSGPLEDGSDEEKKQSRDDRSSRSVIYDARKERTQPRSTRAGNTLHSVPRLHDRRRAFLSSSPQTILRKGNSDPFHTFGTSIDATVNSLLKFHHDCTIPSAYHVEVASVARPPGAIAAFNDAISALRDSCTGYSLLSAMMTVMAAVAQNPAMAKDALIYKNKSSALLRHRLGHDGNVQNDPSQLYQPIIGLLTVETALRNACGARLHADMLAYLIRKSGGLAAIDNGFRTQLLWQEIHRTTFFLARPAVDFAEWVPLQFPEYIDGDTSLSEKVNTTVTSQIVDPSIENEQLRDIFIELRKTSEVLKWAMSSPPNATGDTFAWPMVHSHVCIGRLMSHYADVTSSAKETLTGCFGRRENVEACICLAAAYWTRCCFGVEAVRIGSWLPGGGAVTHDTGWRLLPCLRRILSLDEEPTTNPYEKVRLWALYVGALAEQRGSLLSPEIKEKDWFTQNFVREANKQGLYSWQDAEQVLKGFLHSQHIQPDGSVWFSVARDSESALPLP
jgi:hypothetical protein